MVLSVFPSATSFGATFFGVVLELVMAFWVLRVNKYPHRLSKRDERMAIFLCLANYLFCMVGGDFFTYKDLVEEAGYTQLIDYTIRDFHVEVTYVALINFVNNNYFLFRLIVWGGALFLFYLTANRLQLNRSTFLFYLCCFIAPFTSTSRLALALAVAFWGFSFIVKPFTRSRIISIFLGGIICLCSIWLHRSAPFIILVFPLALLPFNKHTIRLLAVLIPALVIIVQTGVVDFILSMDSTTEDSLIDAQTAQIYLQSNILFKNKGPGHLTRLFFSYLSYFLIFILMIKSIWTGAYKSFPVHIQKLCNATILVIVFALTFLVMPGANTYKTFERLIAFSIVPAAFSLSHMLKVDSDKRLLKNVNLAIYCWVVYDAVYLLYCEYTFYF